MRKVRKTSQGNTDPPEAKACPCRQAMIEAGSWEQLPDNVKELVSERERFERDIERQYERLKVVQADLAESRNRYLQIFEGAPVGYVLVDDAGVIRDANVAAAALLGGPKARLAGQPLASFIAEDDLDVYHSYREAPSTGAGWATCVVRLKPDHGALRYIQVSSQHLRDGVRRDGTVLVTLSDITDLKAMESELRLVQSHLERLNREVNQELEEESEELERAEEALEMSEAKYRLMLNSVNEGVVVIQDFKLRYVNRLVGEVVNAPPEKMLGKAFLDFVHPEDRAAVGAIHLARLEGREAPELYDARVFDHAGRLHWYRINSILIDWDRRPAVLSTLRDVTEIKATEERLEQERVTLNTVLDNIPVMLAMFDFNNTVYFVNAEFEQVLGWTERQFVQGNLMDLCFPDPQQRAEVWEFIQQSADEWRDVEATTRWGTTVTASISSIRLPDKRQIVIGIDVRGRREMEARLDEERRMLETILNNIPIMIIMYNLEGEAILLNPAYVDLLGWTKEDFEATDMLELCFPDPSYREEARTFLLSDTDQWKDLEVTTKSGGVLASSWRVVRVVEGYRIGIGVDIRERRQAEHRLQQAYDRLKQEQAALERKNIALTEVMSQFEQKKKEVAETVVLNIEEIVLPSLERIKGGMSSSEMKSSIEKVERDLEEISSPLLSRLELKARRLTGREREVARLLGQGNSTGEVARLLGLSKPTIQKYRELIRRKLGLTGQMINLNGFLRRLGDGGGGG